MEIATLSTVGASQTRLKIGGFESSNEFARSIDISTIITHHHKVFNSFDETNSKIMARLTLGYASCDRFIVTRRVSYRGAEAYPSCNSDFTWLKD